jgi:hypothetical protein
VDDGRVVDVVNAKVMRCIVNYNEATNIQLLLNKLGVGRA